MFAIWLALDSAACDSARAETWAVVPALERRDGLFDDDPAEAGRLLLIELNCVACHAGMPPAMEGFGKRREGPDLSNVAGRVRLDYLRAMIADPQHAKPGTPMPRVALGGVDERQRQVEAIVNFLASGGGESPVDQMPDRQAAERGRQLFTEVGCAACHDRPGTAASARLPGSYPLGKLGAKYSIPTLARFLHDPLAVRHSGRMPSLKLSDQESRDLANALVEGLKLPPNLHYRAYHGRWDKLPDFQHLTASKQGQVAGFDLGVAEVREHFALEFEGYLHIEQPGSYIFFLTSDDGARLLIDGQSMVEHDGVHPESEAASDKHQLSAGPHHVLVQYFDGGGNTALALEFESGKAVPRQGLAAAMTLTRDPPKKPGKGFRVDPQLAAEGRRLFASAGCAACHEFQRDGQ
ncbi:MAG TPA: PA14 domain-containing protein, partial [Pirellulales bacterium]|nr:PA14 domain-containing protein [Pirellulales bacterium]